MAGDMAQPDYVGLILPILTKVFGLFIPALLAVIALRAWMPSLLGHVGEARVRRALERLLPEVANDLILPDSRSGLTQIDHLALTSKGFLVVETKNYSGSIFGKEREP
jgi:restriction system protein